MKYNILTSNSSATCTISGDTIGYGYVETNKSHYYPYVFKNGNTTVYVNELPNVSGENVYGAGSPVLFSRSPSGSDPIQVERVDYTVSSYGIATRQEAATIGEVGTPSDPGKCVIISELASLGCKTTGTGTYLYNQAVMWKDIVKSSS